MAAKSQARPNDTSSESRRTLPDHFVEFSKLVSNAVGSVWAFVAAVVTIIVWGITGPMFRFSDTWQLVINTGTTIVTFLMVFLIQSTQNRDARAIHLKLDELIHAVKGARDSMVDLEELTEDELEHFAKEFASLRERACRVAQRRTRKSPLAVEECIRKASVDRSLSGYRAWTPAPRCHQGWPTLCNGKTLPLLSHLNPPFTRLLP